MTARIGAGPVVRLGRPADLAAASRVYRRASLSTAAGPRFGRTDLLTLGR